MIVRERFPNAPIVEALHDIQAVFRSPVEVTRLEVYRDAVKGRYPTKEWRVKWAGRIQRVWPASESVCQTWTGFEPTFAATLT